MRNQARDGRLDPAAEVVAGDLTRAETLVEAVVGIDAVVFTQAPRTAAATLKLPATAPCGTSCRSSTAGRCGSR